MVHTLPNVWTRGGAFVEWQPNSLWRREVSLWSTQASIVSNMVVFQFRIQNPELSSHIYPIEIRGVLIRNTSYSHRWRAVSMDGKGGPRHQNGNAGSSDPRWGGEASDSDGNSLLSNRSPFRGEQDRGCRQSPILLAVYPALCRRLGAYNRMRACTFKGVPYSFYGGLQIVLISVTLSSEIATLIIYWYINITLKIASCVACQRSGPLKVTLPMQSIKVRNWNKDGNS
jgi:hypothetical protein